MLVPFLTREHRRAVRFVSRLAWAALACTQLGCGGSEDPPATVTDEDEDPPAKRGDGGTTKPDAGAKTSDAGNKKPDAGSRPLPVPEEPEEQECAAIEKTTPAARTAVDIIFVIDTSGSMIDERDKVRANIAAFMQEFESSPADTHVVMVTDVDPASANVDRSKYRFVGSPVDSKMLYATAGATLPFYSDSLRPNGVTHMVFISDDNDFFPGDAFRGVMEDTLGHEFTFHAIVATPGGSCGGLFGGGAIGTNYLDLADRTGGMKLDICAPDYGQVFGELKKGIVDAVPLPCDYPLADAKGADFDPGKVQMVHTAEGGDPMQFPKAKTREECGDKAGWHYDDEANPTTVNLCPAACETVRAGGTIQIVLGCPPDPIYI